MTLLAGPMPLQPPPPPVDPCTQSAIFCANLEAFRSSLYEEVSYQPPAIDIDYASMVFTLAEEDFCGVTDNKDSAAKCVEGANSGATEPMVFPLGEKVISGGDHDISDNDNCCGNNGKDINDNGI